MGKPVDQRSGGLARPRFGKACLSRRKPLGGQGCKQHQVDAKARIDGLDFVLQETQQMSRLMGGRTEAGLEPNGRAVGTTDQE